MKVSGGVATWSGELGDVTTFEVRFQKGLVGRVWSGIDDFLSKPVVRLGKRATPTRWCRAACEVTS